MKATIHGVQVEGTVKEVAELISMTKPEYSINPTIEEAKHLVWQSGVRANYYTTTCPCYLCLTYNEPQHYKK